MDNKPAGGVGLKQKALHELIEFAVLFLYLAFFFCALATYRMLLLKELHAKALTFAFALINALVIAKVIMIGEYAKVGRRYESRSLFLSAIWKAVVFTLLVLAFHISEELIKHRIHGENIVGTYQDLRTEELFGRSLLVFCTFVTLFGFREVRRVLGGEKFQSLLFKPGAADKPDLST